MSDTRGKNTIENAQVLLLALKLARLQKEIEDVAGKNSIMQILNCLERITKMLLFKKKK